MKFLAIATALFSAALAAPAATSNQESIEVSKLIVRDNNGIKFVTFKLSGDDAKDITCSSNGEVAQIPSEVYSCEDNTAYSFGLIKPTGDSRYAIRVYHQTSPFAGKSGAADIPTVGTAGGNGAADMVYQQMNPATIAIQ